ncbi:MAG: thiol peroxidase [Eubacteriales bacterium]|nr:thiol peroxidase [Eubacteriales bacterium]
MEKRTGVITFAGNPMTLVGKEIKVGDVAPQFTALKNDLTPFSLEELKGKVVLISVVPSVDTGICELQTIRFNQEANQLDNVAIITVSVDLPFAIGRFCGAKGIDKAITLSDHRDLSFGTNYGFVVEELRLLARGIVVIDTKGIVQHVEYVPEIASHPDYEKALAVAKNL